MYQEDITEWKMQMIILVEHTSLNMRLFDGWLDGWMITPGHLVTNHTTIIFITSIEKNGNVSCVAI